MTVKWGQNIYFMVAVHLDGSSGQIINYVNSILLALVSMASSYPAWPSPSTLCSLWLLHRRSPTKMLASKDDHNHEFPLPGVLDPLHIGVWVGPTDTLIVKQEQSVLQFSKKLGELFGAASSLPYSHLKPTAMLDWPVKDLMWHEPSDVWKNRTLSHSSAQGLSHQLSRWAQWERSPASARRAVSFNLPGVTEEKEETPH